MPARRASPSQTVIDFDAPIPELGPPPCPAAPATIAEPQAEYHIAPAWIDTAGRTRTWALKDPHGTQMAEITTKSAARKLAALLTRVMDERGQSR